MLAAVGLAGCGVSAALPRTPGVAASAAARTQIGVHYAVGGTTPRKGWDCSGLVRWSWRQARVELPRTSAGQYAATKRVAGSALKPGDLVFYGAGRRVSHVALYVGHGLIVQAQKTGTVVHTSRLDQFWVSGRIAFGRVRT
jgi:cell wall-associated NlpC family hydrolase